MAARAVAFANLADEPVHLCLSLLHDIWVPPLDRVHVSPRTAGCAGCGKSMPVGCSIGQGGSFQ